MYIALYCMAYTQYGILHVVDGCSNDEVYQPQILAPVIEYHLTITSLIPPHEYM